MSKVQELLHKLVSGQDYAKISIKTERFISDYVSKSSAKGLVIGLSGGLDSSVVLKLSTNALGPQNVLGLAMPTSVTPREDVKHAIELAEALKVEYKTINLDPIIETYAKLLQDDKRARGNLAARIRMSILYYDAFVRGYLVAGTGDKSEYYVGYFCYDEKTRALTKDGFKTYDQLRPNDVVFSLDMTTGQVRECPVKEVYTFNYRGKMIHFDSRAFDIMVTPNHRMLVHPRAGKDPLKMRFRTAEECLRRKRTVFPVPKPWNGTIDNIRSAYRLVFRQKDIVKAADIKINDLFYLFGLFIGDGCCYQGRVTVSTVSMLDVNSYRSTVQRDAHGKFTKLLMQDQENGIQKTYDTYEVLFALPEDSKNAARTNLISILRESQIDFSRSKNLVRISSQEVYSLFSQCGIYAKNKKVPKWILQYPADNLVWLYKGLKDSDGSHGDRINVYYTVSPQLAADYIELCIKIGRLGTFRLRPERNSTIQDKIAETGRCFEISTIGQSHMRARSFHNKSAKWIDYEGKIWCPDIPETHNLLVERNGKLAFCGNTKYGDGGADIMPILHLYKTQVRELARYLGISEEIIQKKSSPRLWANHLAEEEIGMNYEIIDSILHLMIDKKIRSAEIAKRLQIPHEQIGKIKDMVQKNAHKRRPPAMIL